MRNVFAPPCGVTPGAHSGAVPPPDGGQFRTLIEYSSEITAILDASGTIRYASPAAGRVLGIPPEELSGKSITELVHPEDLSAVTETLRKVYPIPGAVESLQWRARRQDGSWRVLRGVIRNLFHVEAVAGVVLIARDVTNRKRLEGQLRSAQRAAATGRLAGGVAHEFSNVLSVILCYAQRAVDAVEAGNPLRADLEEVLGATERAAGLVGQLLSLSSPPPDSQQCVDLNQLVENTIHTLAPILGNRIRVTSALSADLGKVKVDPAQIDQVLLNLALNSRDAMPFGGQIRIETGNVTCASHAVPGPEPGDYVRLTFSDSGQGMDGRTRRRIFDPFFTTKARGKGTGLGLSIAHSIIEEHGGTITVESEVAKGTAFRIYIPRMAEASGLQSAAQAVG
jgi:two-component system, cell cycle sensor histidine kinase and response regulator CckA